MARYVVSNQMVNFPLPWQTDYSWNAELRLSVDEQNLILIKLERGGLNNAVPGPLKVFGSDQNSLVDYTSTYLPNSTDFAISRSLFAVDLNLDGFEDFVVENHGSETPPEGPFPGEQNAYYLYRPEFRGYEEILIPGNDFSHGSAAGRFNLDPYPDLFINNLGGKEQITSYVLVNDGDGGFERKSLPSAFLSRLGPFVTVVDIDQDEIDELVTIDSNGQLSIWSMQDLSNPRLIGGYDLPMSESGVFKLAVADFDGNGRDDLVIVGTGDELKNDLGVTVGGAIKAFIYFDFGTSTQTVVDLFEGLSAAPIVTGGIRVDIVDLDKIGGMDLELRSFKQTWEPVRYTAFVSPNRDVQIESNLGGIKSVQGAYFDFDSDGVLDYLHHDNGRLNIAFGSLLDRYQNVAYDIDGVAGQAYRIYKAAFDRAPDLVGLGFWIGVMDKGATLESVAGSFIASDEFETRYGATNDLEFIQLLYENVLDRQPDAQGYAYWQAAMLDGLSRESVLTNFSESPENKANVAGLISGGIDYTPFLG